MFENPTVNYHAFCNPCAKLACSSEFLYAGNSMRSASQQFVVYTHPPFFYRLRSSSKPTHKKLGRKKNDTHLIQKLHLGNHSG